MPAIPIKDSAASTPRTPGFLSAGFRPFFLLGSIWAAIAIPVWLCVYSGHLALQSALPPAVWHAHEMVYGYAFATVAGFLLTAIPNWTGRLPLRGLPLGVLAGLWLAGRVAVLFSATIGAGAAAVIDLAFPAALAGAIARELVAGRNWRNLPMLVALSLLLAGSLLVHLEALGLAQTAPAGNRLGIATLCLLIALVGGRIVPSFTRNWLAKNGPGGPLPAQAGKFDAIAMSVTVAGLVAWVAAPESLPTAWLQMAAGVALAARLSRWQGFATLAEPLVSVLHAGYGWLSIGLLLLGASRLTGAVPPASALHAITAGAVGTMTLAVMTRATLGHTGRALTAGRGTLAIYALVSLAALLRIGAPFAGEHALTLTWAAGAAWSAAFGLFALLYGKSLLGTHS